MFLSTTTRLSMLLLIIGTIVWSQVPDAYMDEPFHLTQFVKFIDFFSLQAPFSWDPAITTFPGLYLITSVVLGPLLPFIPSPSLLFWCRCVNFLGANLFLYWVGSKKNAGLLLVFFPLNFFYSFLYYTDSLATVSMLWCGVLHFEKRFTLAGVAGIVAVLARQTNILWLFGLCCSSLADWKSLYIQIFTGAAFATFLVWNKGSVVLGHHHHHQLSLHFAQINYFFLTCMLWMKHQHVLPLRRFVGKWILFTLFALYGTVAHPFILSDNRHYSFYFFKRVVERDFFRIFFIPALAALTRIDMHWMFWACLALTLVPTPLLEFRYFALPCSIVLMKGNHGNKKFLLIAFAIVNFITMYVFLFRPFVNADGTLARFMY